MLSALRIVWKGLRKERSNLTPQNQIRNKIEKEKKKKERKKKKP